MIVYVILGLPLVAAFLSCFFTSRNAIPAITVLCAAATLAMATRAAFGFAAGRPISELPDWLALDGLSALIVLVVAWVGALAALYSWGCINHGTSDVKRLRVYYTNFNVFLFALLLVPVVAEPSLTWIALELTALFSVLLVAYENTDSALEAAWKYIALMFMGAAMALMGFLMLFWAFQTAGGGSVYSWHSLRIIAPHMSPTIIKAAFIFILVGFGTKAGFVPLHTWLPDAHSQAPSPVCAMLSGVKTTTALYVILRLTTLLPTRGMSSCLIVVGLVSVGAAALLLIQVQDYKRMFAYSTVEHMGIIFTAVGLGSGAARYGAMAQIVSHSITKSFCFFAAGGVLMIVKTRDIANVRGLIQKAPAISGALIFGGLAIAGSPPMAVFLSELWILKAGLAQGNYVVTSLLALFIVIAFVGIAMQLNRMVFSPPDDPVQVDTRLPLTCRIALILAAIPVVVLGIYMPRPLDALLRLAASALTR